MLEKLADVDIARGLEDLPPAESAGTVAYSVTIDASGVGLVRIYYQKQPVAGDATGGWCWTAVRAEEAHVTPQSVTPTAPHTG